MLMILLTDLQSWGVPSATFGFGGDMRFLVEDAH